MIQLKVETSVSEEVPVGQLISTHYAGEGELADDQRAARLAGPADLSAAAQGQRRIRGVDRPAAEPAMAAPLSDIAWLLSLDWKIAIPA